MKISQTLGKILTLQRPLQSSWAKRLLTFSLCIALISPPVLVRKSEAQTVAPQPLTLVWATKKNKLAVMDLAGNVAVHIETAKVPRKFLRKARGSDRRLEVYVKNITGASLAGDGSEVVNSMSFAPDGSPTKLIANNGTSLKFEPAKKRGKYKVKGSFGGVRVKYQVKSPAAAKWVKRANKLLSKGGGRKKARSAALSRSSAKERGFLSTVKKRLIKVGGRVIQYGLKGAGFMLGVATVGAGTAAGGVVGGGIVILGGIGLAASLFDLVISSASDVSQITGGPPVVFRPLRALGNGPLASGTTADILDSILNNGFKGLITDPNTWKGFVVGVFDSAIGDYVAKHGMEPDDWRVIDNTPLSFSGGPDPHVTYWVAPIGFSNVTVTISWDMFTIPDSIKVLVNKYARGGFPTGLVSGAGSVNLSVPGFQTIQVIMNEGGNPDLSTAWEYTLIGQ